MACNYWCAARSSNPSCQFCSSKGDLVIDQEGEYACPNNEEQPLKLMGHTVLGKTGAKLTKQQIQQERKKRSKSHFKSEILPTLDKRSKQHFEQKLSQEKK